MHRQSNAVGKLAYFSARHKWIVLASWVAVLAAAFVLAGGIGDVLGKNSMGAVTESEKAQRLMEEHFGNGGPPQEWIVVESETLSVEDEAFKAMISGLVDEIAAYEGVTGVVSYLDGAPGMVTVDGQTALVQVTLLDDYDQAEQNAAPVVTSVRNADANPNFRVTVIGEGSINAEFNHLAEETLMKGEMIGISVALVILFVVFGAAVAAGLPILLAIVAIVVAIALSAVAGEFLPLEEFVVQVITMIGLAVGIDYALFIVKRYREELENGATKLEAITLAGETSTKTVIVSGVSVIIALSGMLIVPESTFRSFGMGAIFVVAAAVLAASTLLPATIAVLGNKLNWVRLPKLGRRAHGAAGATAVAKRKNFSDRTTGVVMAHPIASVVLTSALLVAMASFSITIHLGGSGIESLPDDNDALHAFHVLTEDFGAGVQNARIVIERNGVDADEVEGAIGDLLALVDADGFFGDTTVDTSANGNIVLVTAIMRGDFTSPDSEAAVLRLRDQYVPASLDPADVTAYVGGNAASMYDDVRLISGFLPVVFALVLTATFVLLLMVFRSIVVPLKAVLMNLLSVGAAYGLLVLVFQHGIGADLFGFKQVAAIEFWLPLFLFSVLFGLSMDYHVFMLSRIKESYDETGRNRESVAFGLRSTAGIITGAALIMVAVFGGFALGDVASFQQMGFGLAMAVIIDVTLIRSVLVPASMELLGDWNWYFPSWLGWLPRLDLEGRRPAPVPVPAGGSE